MKFTHNTKFNEQFDQIPDLAWYPYVGQNFEQSNQRVMVFAHNIYIKPECYESKMREFASKAKWADAIEGYTYAQADWTQTFRYFIKCAVGLTENYGCHSEPAIIDKVDSFVERIAHLNFIQDLVKSERAFAIATPEQVSRSKAINRQFLEILGITHCICWGGHVFQYVTGMDGYKILEHEKRDKKGFAYARVENNRGSKMHVLKVHHPCNPQGFGPFSSKTHDILSDFLAKPNP